MKLARYIGARTTRIYCLPSCKARLPHDKNILFVQTRQEAIEEGFRGCLRCKSEFYPDTNPEWLKKIKKFLDTHISNKIDENELIKLAHADISTIRRYFKNEYVEILRKKGPVKQDQIKNIFDENGCEIPFAQTGSKVVITLKDTCSPNDLIRRAVKTSGR